MGKSALDADLDLFDDAAAVGMFVLDRILDRDDVSRVAVVDVGDKGGERRGLARAGRTADEHQSAWQAGEPFDVVREMQIADARNPQWQGADGRRRLSPLAMKVHPEASEARQCEREVDGFALAVARFEAARHERQGCGFHVLGLERRLRQPP